MRDMPALPDPLPDTIAPWPLWRQAMQQMVLIFGLITACYVGRRTARFFL